AQSQATPGPRGIRLRPARQKRSCDHSGTAQQQSIGTEGCGEKSKRPDAATASAQDAQARANCAVARMGKTRGRVRGALVIHRPEVAEGSGCEAEGMG